MTKCLACGGVYLGTQPDGTRYFHACPPAVRYVEIATGRELTLTEAQAVTDGATIRREEFARPNARDENLTTTRIDSDDPAVKAARTAPKTASGDAQRVAVGLMKSAGAGVRDV